MWKSVLAGIILENVESLRYYQTVKNKKSDTLEHILQYVSSVVLNLPWYFRFPVLILASIIGMLCIVTTGHALNVLSPKKRSSFLSHIKFIPLFDMLNKLVRSTAFLKLFDSLPLEPDYMKNFNLESN